MHDIALIGRARSGKDTVAARLVAKGFTRVAFADPLKAAALAVDPILEADTPHPQLGPEESVRLAEMVRLHGWEIVKDQFPEARRILQRLGTAVRERDEGFWVRAALEIIADIWSPVVVSDVRYPNEADALSERGFRLVRILRPEAGALADGASRHSSETALDRYPEDAVIRNSGTIADLYAQVDALIV